MCTPLSKDLNGIIRSSGFHEGPDTVVCQGCQEFKEVLFSSEDLKGREIMIHKNFAELSQCADKFCGLCKYFRRAICYSCDWVSQRYDFSDSYLQTCDDEISTMLQPMIGDVGELLGRDCFIYVGKTFNLVSLQFNDEEEWNRQTRGDNPSLESLLELSRQWLAICRQEHGNCGPQGDTEVAYLPRRLLDVGKKEQEVIRLIISEDLPNAEVSDYVTLSYCWGQTNDTARTTKDNLADRLNAIATCLLPKTLQDAIDITRAHSIRYLWIDALCIIQDEDNRDWQHEVTNMGKIYRHSLFTIAASGARDSSVGCFYRREASSWPVQDYHFFDENKAREVEAPMVLRATVPDWEISVENSALAKRGWVLQERMLASRTLFWTADGLFWECNELRASEYEVGGLQYPKQFYPRLDELVESIGGEAQDSVGHFELATTKWIGVLERFSEKTFTVPTDKLAAIAGLGNELARRTGGVFEKGVFTDNIVQELAWILYFKSIEPQAARIPGVPSWSWASINQEIRLSIMNPNRTNYEDLVTNVAIDGHQLRVRGRLGSVRVKKTTKETGSAWWGRHDPNPCLFEPVKSGLDEAIYKKKREYAVFDTLADTLSVDGGSIRCLQWIRWEDRSGAFENREGTTQYYTVTGSLIVSPVDEQKNMYRRIGWLELVDAEFFEGEEYQNIVLV